jgi:hypothetical protein
MRLVKAGTFIAAIVMVVGSLPVVGVWWFADDLAAPPPGAGFGFVDEEFRYASRDGTQIAARLRLPVGPGPHPLVVVAHGSGRTTRDRYGEVSEAFALNGYAFLSYDKRGVGDSQGAYSGVGPANSAAMFALLADDIIAGAETAAARDDIDADRVGVYGVSQGGWIAPVALSRSDLLGFMIIISGPTVSVGSEIRYSELTGESEGNTARSNDQELSARLAEFEGPHGFDPLATLERLDVPALWILGGADRSIPIPETLARLEVLVEQGRPFQFEVIPDVGHGMRNAFSGERYQTFPRIFRWLVEEIGE